MSGRPESRPPGRGPGPSPTEPSATGLPCTRHPDTGPSATRLSHTGPPDTGPPGTGAPDDGLPPARLTAAREALEAERAEAVAAISALARDFDGIVDAASSVATDDEHDPEGATIAFERAQVAALLERTRGRLADIDLALARIGSGSYGRCERCGQPIAAGRLAARPAARTCIRCAAAYG